MDCSCGCTEQGVAAKGQGVTLQLGGWVRSTVIHSKNFFVAASDLDVEIFYVKFCMGVWLVCDINLLKPTGYVKHQQFNIQQLYALPTLYLCVLFLSKNKQRLVPLTS
jgi:hypothetical protein